MIFFRKLYLLATVVLKWITRYLFNKIRSSKKPQHILFCLVDHFEPGTANASYEIEQERMKTLLTKYPKLVEKHKDSAGNSPMRTWFFPPHYHRNYSLKVLVSLCEKGYGEIELHLHHGKTKPDTAENLEETINQCIIEYAEFGIFGAENGQTKYGFIHGNSALDNSRNGQYCGVNNEIEILNRTGCYADFTFPVLIESNPKQINSIFYATNNSNEPKSYDRGVCVKRGDRKRGDLMMIQGPIYPFFMRKNLFGLRIFGSAITGKPPVTKKRVDAWIKTGVHVKGQRNWVVVKIHTHGGSEDSKAVLGQEMDDVFTYLETKYNDGSNYILHYVTARELYNVIKAVEAGESDDNPEHYRDYKIAPPKYDSSPDIAGVSEKLQSLISKTYH